ncbi:MAG: hypothetical protein ACOC2X_00035 [Bacillota bacterium]
MRKLIAVIFTLTSLALLAACGEEDQETSTPPSVEDITVEGRDPVQDGDQDPYPVTKNGDITLEIAFSNPDNVEFNTVQINGTTYRAHRFSEDSTSDNLVLNLSAGRMPGETLYEIEEIEYIDEEGVKSIELDEDNAYTLFVMRSVPEATFEEISVDNSSIEFELNIEDSDETLSEASLELVHEEDGVIREEPVEAGVMTHEFDDLRSDTAYSLRVVASYETDDPEVSGGMVEDEVIGETETIETEALDEPTVDITNESVDETSYTFDLEHENLEEVIENDALTVKIRRDDAEDDEVVQEKEVGLDDATGIEIDELLSDNAYTIEVYADYNLDDGEGLREEVLLASSDFTTAEKDLPAIDTSVESVDEDGFNLSIDTTAFKETAEIEHMMLYVYEGDEDTFDEDDDYLKRAKLSSSKETFKFDGLHADQDITVFIVPSYRLDDGRDWRTDEAYRQFIETPANQEPTVDIDDVALSQEGADVSLDVDDPDDTLIEGSFTYYLYQYDSDSDTEEEVGKVEDSEETSQFIPYEKIQSDKSYRVEVEADYDLRDDEGVHEAVRMDSSLTSASLDDKAPSITIHDITENQDSIVLDYTILDNDDTIDTEAGGIVLKVGDESYTLDELSDTYTIEDLNSDTSYDMAFELTYDLGDDEGERTTTLSETVTTDAKAEPTLEITETNPLKEGLEYTLDQSDPDDVASYESGRVLEDGEEVATVDEGEELSGLHSDTEYTFEVTYTYDLNDGEGERTLKETTTFETDAYTTPSVEITDLETTQDGFRFDYAFNDPDGVMDEDSLRFAYDSEEQSLSELSGTLEETDLLSDTEYALTLEAAYDLNDGEGEQTLSASETATTNARSAATGTSQGSSSDPGASTFDFDIDDADDTIVDDTLTAELTDEDGDVIEERSLDASDTTLTHYGLIYDETLTLTVTADIDLHDGEDATTTTLFESTLDVPEYVTYEEDTLDDDAFEGTVDLSELEDVLDFDTLEHSLRYVYNDEVVGEASLSNQKLSYDVNGLLADREMELSISGSYDLGDGTESGEIFSTIIKTEANSTPTAEIDITDYTYDDENGSIEFEAPVDDPDDVRLSDRTYAHLYRENSEGDMELYESMKLDDDPDDPTYEFTGLELDYQAFYLIEIETDYYLGDGRGNHEDANIGNDTVLIDVTPDEPEGSIANVDVSKGEMSFDASVEDRHETIQDGSLYAVLYKDGEEADRQALDSMDETLTFNELENNTEYTVDIVADVDLKEASIRDEEVLSTHTFTSYDAAPDVSTTLDSDMGEVTADIAITDPDDTIDTDTLEAVLYDDGEEVSRQTLDSLSESVTFDELENDTEYSLDIEADVDYDEASPRTGETLNRDTVSTPDVEASIGFTEEVSEHRIDLRISVDDPYDTISGSEGTVYVYDEDDNEVTSFEDVGDGNELSLNGLDADSAYTYVFEADTDYLDGQGTINRVLGETTVTTEAYETPTADVTMDDITHDDADFTVGLDNPDSLSADITDIKLYQDDSEEDAIDPPEEGSFTWDELNSDTDYTIEVTFEYNMQDGSGTQTDTISESFTTESYTEPDASIDNVVADDDSVDFTVNETDPDNRGSIDKIELLMDDEAGPTIDSPSAGDHEFNDLYSDQDYTIRVSYTYDLADGEGEQTTTVTESFTTDALDEPTITIEDQTITGDDIEADLSTLDDPDNTVGEMTLELWYDGELKDQHDDVNGDSSYTFEDVIASDTEYTIILRADVNLEDSNSPYEDEILDKVKIRNLD